MALSIVTFSLITLSITALSIVTFNFMILSITPFSIIVNKKRHSAL